ncbi:1-deoxy-D-xylulose-5-phosphate synthase [Treponema sp.]|uniref:1-deoxy-D-xylulose-5-phosphate synthase n=1 Tax=Treponema sp. TaxID=166 RepID=UPI0025DA4F9C|nr:1-deoxy-D-xylulose-5-phosphate synthase [Treponema sp.]MCR5218110.1 1-deoxy-D-xylulose-5-phosphate synthase [Treponema sp.]
MILQTIKSPQDLKQLDEDKLPLLASQMRDSIISTVSENGGHLASNLGVVELTIALHRVFNSPDDAIVWDVSHQCYPHKMLTGRYGQFSSIRKEGGISGFTRIKESPHDYFDAGHASSSISSALGLLAAWKLQGRNDKVIAVIGDGALTGGMAFEALSHAGQLCQNLIVVVNDNQMSISPNTGALSRYLSRLTTGAAYQKIRRRLDHIIDRIPYFNRHIGKVIYRMKRALKGLLLSNNLFVDLGFEYAGPLDGHNIKELENTFKRIKKIPRPVVVHVVTKKGKGYSPAENNPSAFHGIGPFNISDGSVEKFNALSFTEAFSRIIVSMGEKDSRICAITAAMSKGTGLDTFSRKFPERFFDVGIAEEHAVTFAGGLAAGGLIPFVAIYSTFMQRSVDQVIEDIALQNRHAVIVMDRAGAVPGDGETHQGIFDISLLRCIPDLDFLTVVSGRDMELCLDYAVNVCKGPVCLRWSKNSCPSEIEEFSQPVVRGRGILVPAEKISPSLEASLEDADKDGRRILLVTTGSMYGETLVAARNLLMKGYLCSIYVLRFIKPFDTEYFTSIARDYNAAVIIEDGIRIGSFAEYLDMYIHKTSALSSIKTQVLAFPDEFLSNGERDYILEEAGLSPECIVNAAEKLF